MSDADAPITPPTALPARRIPSADTRAAGCTEATGGAVDRDRPLAFTFDGKPYLGFEGDTIASALLANCVHVVGRSFKG